MSTSKLGRGQWAHRRPSLSKPQRHAAVMAAHFHLFCAIASHHEPWMYCQGCKQYWRTRRNHRAFVTSPVAPIEGVVMNFPCPSCFDDDVRHWRSQCTAARSSIMRTDSGLRRALDDKIPVPDELMSVQQAEMTEIWREIREDHGGRWHRIALIRKRAYVRNKKRLKKVDRKGEG